MALDTALGNSYGLALMSLVIMSSMMDMSWMVGSRVLPPRRDLEGGGVLFPSSSSSDIWSDVDLFSNGDDERGELTLVAFVVAFVGATVNANAPPLLARLFVVKVTKVANAKEVNFIVDEGSVDKKIGFGG